MTAERRTLDSALASSPMTGPMTGPGDRVEYRPTAVMPDVKVVKIGGQSVLDRGRAALFPILDEIIEARKQGIQVVVLAGGGTRARHIYAVASDLELPPGCSRRSAATCRGRTRACCRCSSPSTAASTS